MFIISKNNTNVGLYFLILLIVLSIPLRATEREDYKNAKTKNSVAGWESYLKLYPNMIYAKSAKVVLDSLLFLEAKQNFDNPTILESLKKRCRTISGTEKLDALLIESNWELATRTHTISSYSEYIKKNPYSEFKEAAEDSLLNIIYLNAKNLDTIESYTNYLQYPYKNLGYYQGEYYKGSNDQDYYERYRRDFRDRWYRGNNRTSARLRLIKLTYDRLSSMDATLKEWNDLYEEIDYFWSYGLDVEDSKMKASAEKKIENILYEEIVANPTLDLVNEYLSKYPMGLFTQQILIRSEQLFFEKTKNLNTVKAFDEYVERYPYGSHLTELQACIDTVLYNKAQKDDWYTTYEEYLKKCPDGKFVIEVQERLNWLKANKAVFEVDYPKELEPSEITQPGARNPFWEWTIIFKETSGKIGYKIKGWGQLPVDDGNYSLGGGGEVIVPAGGQGKNYSWCCDSSHEFCNHSAMYEWSGEDAGGHGIRIKTKTKLLDKNCPGKRN
jgi:hypothetical protein